MFCLLTHLSHLFEKLGGVAPDKPWKTGPSEMPQKTLFIVPGDSRASSGTPSKAGGMLGTRMIAPGGSWSQGQLTSNDSVLKIILRRLFTAFVASLAARLMAKMYARRILFTNPALISAYRSVILKVTHLGLIVCSIVVAATFKYLVVDLLCRAHPKLMKGGIPQCSKERMP
jgi:hypothetical protein